MSRFKAIRLFACQPGTEASKQDQSIVLQSLYHEGALLFSGSGSVVEITGFEYDRRRAFYSRIMDAFACLGLLQAPGNGEHASDSPFSSSSYLVVIKGHSLVGKLPDYTVYRVTDVGFVSLASPFAEDANFPEMRKLLTSGTFFYAMSNHDNVPYDLTLNIQARAQLIAAGNSTSQLYLRQDVGTTYLWNAGLLAPLLRAGIDPSPWLVNLICGSFHTMTVFCGSSQARVGVVSRLSIQRPGTRFNVRGVNDFGDVANFVETEQFIYLDDRVTSYVQLRGTVPLFWEQPGLQVGSHKIKLSRPDELVTGAFERHFTHIASSYGATMIVNLLGSKQGESMLSRAFKAQHEASSLSNCIPFLAFDYHLEMQNRGEKCLTDLTNRLDSHSKSFGLSLIIDGKLEMSQTGAFRINCVDCLDRTNAVQKLVGLELVLPEMLKILPLKSQGVHIVKRFSDSLRECWQTNGDQVSRIYAGTGALGGGKNKLRDVQRSAARTIQHKYFDTNKQEAMLTLLKTSSLSGKMKLISDQYFPRRLTYLPPPLLSTLMHRRDEFCSQHRLRCFVGTWNVNGGKHFRSLAHYKQSIIDWLLELPKTVIASGPSSWGYLDPTMDVNRVETYSDLFAVGFEEIVDLSTGNIVSGSTSSANQREWAKLISSELNRSANQCDQYVLVSTVQLVGVCLFLFIRNRLSSLITDLSTASVKTGLGGTTGNKGAVAIRFQLGCSSFCFVCSHFAAGQNAVRERNDDFNETCRRLNFSNGLNLLSHNYVFWCGDFNYRINLPGQDVKRLAAERNWPELIEADQMSIERQRGNIFPHFHEGPINFAPTYKYDTFCDDYDTSEKARSPAWTDRILWRAPPMTFPCLNESTGCLVRSTSSSTTISDKPPPVHLICYNRAELKTSDHRPVGALFDVEFDMILRPERRQLLVQSLNWYGPWNVVCRVSLVLIDVESNSLVGDPPKDLFVRDSFVDNLESLATSQGGSLVTLHFINQKTVALVYPCVKQAEVAANIFSTVSTPLIGAPGLRPTVQGYRIQFKDISLQRVLPSSSLASKDAESSPDISTDIQLMVDLAERDDLGARGPSASPDAFTALPHRSQREVEETLLGDLIPTTFNLDFDSDDDDDMSVSGYAADNQSTSRRDLSGLKPSIGARILVPPPARPPPPPPARLSANDDVISSVSANSSPSHRSITIERLVTPNSLIGPSTSCVDLMSSSVVNNIGATEPSSSAVDLIDLEGPLIDLELDIDNDDLSRPPPARPPPPPPRVKPPTTDSLIQFDPLDPFNIVIDRESTPSESHPSPVTIRHSLDSQNSPQNAIKAPIARLRKSGQRLARESQAIYDQDLDRKD